MSQPKSVEQFLSEQSPTPSAKVSTTQEKKAANTPIRELTHNFKKVQKRVLDGEIVQIGSIYLCPFPPSLLDEGMKALNGNVVNNLEITNEVLNILKEFKNKSSF